MNEQLSKKIEALDLPEEIKEALLSITIDNVYIVYKHLHAIINGLPINTQNEILFYVYEYNKKLYDKEKQIQSELRAIQNIRNTKINDDSIVEDNTQINSFDKNKTNNSEIDLDISDYMKVITQVEKLDDLEEILPNYFTDKYDSYIQKILLELQKEAKSYYDLAITSDDEEVKKDLINEFRTLNEKIKYIIEYHQEQLLQDDDTLEENNHTHNKVIYLKTESGTPYALKDLKTIDPTYYDSFNTLFKSIENGTFKNFKAFSGSNSNIGNISEVRGFKTRIIFDRISNDTYIILRMLVKKIDNDTYYQTALSDRVNAYRKQKENLNNLLANEQYISECNEISEEIKSTLTSKARKGYM